MTRTAMGVSEATCEAPQNEGEACLFSNNCVASLECVEGVCADATPRADGEPCSSRRECASRHCDFSQDVEREEGFCAPYLACTLSP